MKERKIRKHMSKIAKKEHFWKRKDPTLLRLEGGDEGGVAERWCFDEEEELRLVSTMLSPCRVRLLLGFRS
jgi:hypothetical protein